MILAMPGFTPGRGEGTMASTRCRPIASAASCAIRWSSAVVLMVTVLILGDLFY
jgi:hypothetical protein